MQPLGADEPTVVGPYRLLGRLGSGGMGRVYLGRSAGGRTVAVKIVHPHFALDEEFRTRFRREVEAARRVGGAWTAPVLDADPEAPVPWVATAYAAGPSLAQALSDGGPLPPATVRALGAGLAEALAAVHELGLVHRDVKPSNVLLTLDGPLLIDFGIARAMEGTASLTSTGVSIGSPGYMAPEQILGKGVSGAADVFSLGAVLVYAATGEPPFPGDSSASLLYKVVHEEPVLGALGGEVRELAAACLAKDPGERPTPGEVARRLAPDGAARLVAGGWLPGALVEQVSRSAVRLLNLEAGATSAGSAGSAGSEGSGPVGFSRVSVGEQQTGAGGQPSGTGAFGPAPVMPAGSPDRAMAPAQDQAQAPIPVQAVPSDAHAAVVPAAEASAAPAVLPPQDAPPYDATVPPSPGEWPGKVSVSLAATSVPGIDGRGRRVSCTLALAVAGALAAVTVGTVFVVRMLPSGGSDDSASSGAASKSSAPAPAEPSDGYSAADGGEGAVPARYLGTWEGEGTGLGGTVPMGTFRVTLHQARIGGELGRVRNTDPLGTSVCIDVLTLKKASKDQLVARAVGAATNPSTCVADPSTVRLTPTGDGLKYASDSSGSGKPVARLARLR
ncbi:serine/threonine-protein kinase [Streptomyces sp. YIM S03343]